MRLIAAILVGLVLVLVSPSPAHAIRYHVQRAHTSYKYGCSANIYVNTFTTDDLKVTAIWTHRTDEAAWTEIGHSTKYYQNPAAFYAWGEFGLYYERHIASNLPKGTYQRYHAGYDYRDNRHNFWFNWGWLGEVYLATMTSCWPNTNAEKEPLSGSSPGGSNLACFKDLAYKNYEWGSWSNWTGNQVWWDNDPYWSAPYVSATHVDVVHD